MNNVHVLVYYYEYMDVFDLSNSIDTMGGFSEKF